MDEKDLRIQELQRQIEILQYMVELLQKRMKQIKGICTEETEEKEKSR